MMLKVAELIARYQIFMVVKYLKEKKAIENLVLAIQETNMTKKKSTIPLSVYDRATFKEMMKDAEGGMSYDKYKKKYSKPRPMKIK